METIANTGMTQNKRVTRSSLRDVDPARVIPGLSEDLVDAVEDLIEDLADVHEMSPPQRERVHKRWRDLENQIGRPLPFEALMV